MYNLRDELIKSIIKSLKIDDNIFNKETIRSFIEHVPDDGLQSFYQRLFGADHSYLNGLDRVAKVAEAFRPDFGVCPVTTKANFLISMVAGMNKSIFEEHGRTGIAFEVLLKVARFPTLDKEDMLILNAVKPHYDIKTLISKINHYPTAKECLEAFKSAINNTSKQDANLITDSRVKALLGRGR
jgi:hypothetical protein